VPHLIALAGEDLENNLTIIIPMMEAIRPIEAKARGKNIMPSFCVCENSEVIKKVEAMAIQATIEPQYDSKISELSLEYKHEVESTRDT
jgi:hypothetical protein